MKIILIIMMIFLVIGGIDHILGNKYGYGKAFEEGFQSMGTLALSIAAIYAASSLIATYIKIVSEPFYEITRIDPSIVTGLLFGADMGGYILSVEVAKNVEIGIFSGVILGSTIGTVWLFTIPVSISIVSKDDYKYLMTGLLCGIATAPVGCLLGGLFMKFTSYDINIQQLLYNFIPIIAFSWIIIILLWLKKNLLIHIFEVLARIVSIIIITLTVIAVVQQVLEIRIPYFDKMMFSKIDGITGLDEGIIICGRIAIILAGAFPLIHFIEKHCGRLLKLMQKIVGINEASSSGLIASCANPIPMLHMFKDMDNRGKVINSSFLVSGSFLIGDLLGFVAGVNQEMLTPFFVAKVIGGILAIALSLKLCNVQKIK